MLRIGQGFDAHQFVEGRKLLLGGVEIPYEKGLLGHSDADVLLHAIIDSLLGAMGENDIGHLFPDIDQRYRGISSIALLETTEKIMSKKKWRLVNLDATVIAQKPKIAPYISKMKETIAKALNTSSDCINIKGKTTEEMGFTGREEGIAAMAVCLITL